MTLQVADLIREGVLAIGDGYRAKNSELARDGLPFARAGNINDGFHFEGGDCFPEASLPRVGNKLSRPGDVVFTSKGTVGRFAFVRDDTPSFVYSPQLCFWRSLDSNRLDPRFLYFWMFGAEFYGQFKGVSGQTDMAEYVSLTDQRRMSITLPPISDQRAIAAVLGALDDQIEANRSVNRTAEALALAVFVDWFIAFGPTRAKIDGRAAYLSPDVWQSFPDSVDDFDRPLGWSVRPVYGMAEFRNGAAYRNMHFSKAPEGRPVVKIAELKAGVTDNTKFTATDLGDKFAIDSGDVLFSWSGNPDTSIDTFIWSGGPAWLNQHIFRVRTNGQASLATLYFQLKALRPEFAEIARDKQTTGLGHVTSADMKRLMVCSPSRRVAEAYDRIAAPIFSQLLANDLQNHSLAQTRDLLLPRMLSGAVRFQEAETLAGGVL